jgi:hypothetical protein
MIATAAWPVCGKLMAIAPAGTPLPSPIGLKTT